MLLLHCFAVNEIFFIDGLTWYISNLVGQIEKLLLSIDKTELELFEKSNWGYTANILISKHTALIPE